MSATLVDGTAIAKDIRAEVAAGAAELAERGIIPGLAVVLVGDDRASHTYVRSKARACKKAGMYSEVIQLPADTSQDEILRVVEDLNRRDEIDGFLVQLPLPAGVNSNAVIEAIDPAKDVDGFHPVNFGKLTIGLDAFVPATPMGIMEILRRHEVPIKGAEAVVVGRSNIVGKPIALLLMHNHATVTICHSRTRYLADICRRADILIAAVGEPAMVGVDFVKDGAVVIDVGTNAVSDPNLVKELYGDDPKRSGDLEKKGYTIVGDVHTSVAAVAGLLTPVPGGVGPLTIAMLLANCLEAARRRRAGGK